MADLKEIIEQGIEKYKRDRVGKVNYPPLGNETATKDAIRHFANGLGDPNPLWRDEDYAKNSHYGGLIAPPFFLNAVSESQAITGLPGLIATFVGSEWEWYQPIRVNDRFSVTNKLLDLKELPDNNGRRRLMQSGLLNYSNQNGELVGSCRWDIMRTETKPGQSKRNETKQEPVQKEPQRYSEDELAKIYAAVEAEEVRGTNPRFFEEVNLGDELIPVVKGPLSISDMVAWAIGISWHRIELAHGMKLRYLRANPGLAYIDPEWGSAEPIANSHFWPSAAGILYGLSKPLDLGFQRVSWLGHLITNWMSDFGFLQKLEVRLKGLVQFGDTLWCQGKVTGKRKKSEECLVDLELTCRNQHGEITTMGNAVVIVPSKASFLKSKAGGQGLMNLIEVNEKLNQYLRLASFPVAVRMLEPGQEIISDGVVLKSRKKPMPLCQGVSLSRRYGSTVLMEVEDMSCPFGAVAVGFLPPKPEFLDGSFEVPYWVRTKEARSKIAHNVSKLEFGKYKSIISAPLEKAEFDPQLVIVYGNPAQLMRLVQSCIYLTGEPVISHSYATVGCSAYISKTILTDECQFVLSGAGDRIFAFTQDHEACFSIPMSKMEGVLKGLEETHQGGMRYPSPTYLKFQIELPDTYKKLLASLQDDRTSPIPGDISSFEPSGNKKAV